MAALASIDIVCLPDFTWQTQRYGGWFSFCFRIKGKSSWWIHRKSPAVNLHKTIGNFTKFWIFISPYAFRHHVLSSVSLVHGRTGINNTSYWWNMAPKSVSKCNRLVLNNIKPKRVPRKIHTSTVEPGYNDVGLCDISSIASATLWYQLILRC